MEALILTATIVTLLAKLFLSFIIAEDAFCRGSKHSVRWGVFSFFFSAITIFAYYLTRHRFLLIGQDPNEPPLATMPTRKDLEKQEIRPKIFIWILGISLAIIILTLIAAIVLVMILTAPAMPGVDV